jgi:hypothetical protein
MTESMVERVARAIFEVEYPGGEVDEYRWERSKEAYLAQAQAAIEEMREPTDAMVDAGDAVEPGVTGYTDALSHYQAMINAALNEQVSG